MERVLGFGGFFFRAKDPVALGAWYHKNLGITPAPTADGGEVWEQAAGQTVFNPFPADTDYFGNPAKQWMLNFRVKSVEKMAEQLKAAGTAVEVTSYPYGAFGRLVDPEGNPIELWEAP